MDDVKTEEFFIGRNRYSVNLDDIKRAFTIKKDGEYWSAIEINVSQEAMLIWKQNDEEFNKISFLEKVAPYFVKVGIYNNDITKIGNDKKMEVFSFVSINPRNPNEKRIMDTPNETLEYYKKQAEEISKPRIGF